MLDIKVLGPGCANCKKVEAIAQQAVLAMGVEANIAKVTRIEEILEYNLLSTPGLVVNSKVVCSGRVPSPAEVTIWLADALEAALHAN